MRFNTFTITLAMTAAASADLYSLEFFGSADFVGPINGLLFLDLDDFGSGSFLGSVGTNFGPASADGTATFASDLSVGALDGTLDFGPFGSYDLTLSLFTFGDGGVGTLTGFDPGAGGVVTGDVFIAEWTITAIPAPGALALLGLAGLGRRRRA